MELLRILSRENLPFALAVPAGFATLEDGGPAVIHRALPGRELDLATLRPGPGLAASLGTSIAALHEVSVDAVAATAEAATSTAMTVGSVVIVL